MGEIGSNPDFKLGQKLIIKPPPANALPENNIDNVKKTEKLDNPEKEPWQITRDEFVENYYLHGTTEDNLPTIKSLGGITKGGFIKIAADTHNTPVAYATDAEESGGYFTRSGRGNKKGAILVAKLNDIENPKKPEKKKPFSSNFLENPELIIIREEEKRIAKYKAIIPIDVDPHRYLIEQAIKDGNNIPIEVLKDYPDIALTLGINLPPLDTTRPEYQWDSLPFYQMHVNPEIYTTEKLEFGADQFLKKFQETKIDTSGAMREILDELEFRAKHNGKNERNWQFETPKKEYFRELKNFITVNLDNEKSPKKPVEKIKSFFKSIAESLTKEKGENSTNAKKEFSPEELIGNLKNNFNLNQEYALQVGVWEGYTLEQHTLMTMKQYERYFSENMDTSLVSKNEFRLLLALHDIGKTRAIMLGKDKTKQHEYNKKIIPAILNMVGIQGKRINLMTEVVSQDWIGSYMKGDVAVEEAALEIQGMSRKDKASLPQLFDLLQIYYISDASSYTVDAGGKQSLDYLFKFKRADGGKKATVDLSENVKEKMTLLKNRTLAT